MSNIDTEETERLYEKLQKFKKAKMVLLICGVALLLFSIVLIFVFNSSLGFVTGMVGLLSLAVSIIVSSYCQQFAITIYQNSDQYEHDMKNRQQREAEIYAAQHPQCPACHGHNTQRISTPKKLVSTSLTGLASSTIGKQYECLECKHKW